MATDRTRETLVFVVSLLLLCLGASALGCSGGGDGGDGGDDAADGIPNVCYDTPAELATLRPDNYVDIRASGNYLYYAEIDGDIVEVPIGGGPARVVVSEIYYYRMELVGDYVYWLARGDARTTPIMRSSIADGATSLVVIAEAPLNGFDFVVNRESVFWFDSSGIYEVPHDGSGGAVLARPTDGWGMVDMIADDRNVCWVETNGSTLLAVLRCLDLARRNDPPVVIADGIGFASSLNIRDGSIFWLEPYGLDGAATLRTSSTSGGSAMDLMTLYVAHRLFVSGDRFYWGEGGGGGGEPFDLYMAPRTGGSRTLVTPDVDAFTVDECHVYTSDRGGTENVLRRRPR